MSRNLNDRLIRRKEICEITTISDTKIKELIKDGKMIKPVPFDDFQEDLFSYNELQDWIENLKKKRVPNESKVI